MPMPEGFVSHAALDSQPISSFQHQPVLAQGLAAGWDRDGVLAVLADWLAPAPGWPGGTTAASRSRSWVPGEILG